LNTFFRKLGPGLLFAGAAIGVSHLVQSTRAGADFGMGLLWALLAINLIKYPFFQFGMRYAAATQQDLLEGYAKMGKWVLVCYFILSFATMFTIQTAVTIVTAGIASSIFESGSLVFWTTLIISLCFLILLLGRYKILDSIMKYIVLALAICTISAVIIAFSNFGSQLTWEQNFPKESIGIAFLIAFMGWMPAPLDISIWQSMWTVEKQKISKSLHVKDSFFDFNVGYVTTIFLGIGFLLLGALVMHGKGEGFSGNATQFANQLIAMYQESLGDWATFLIGIAALTTMFSTTLTTLDGSPRVMNKTSLLLLKDKYRGSYLFWLLLLALGTLVIFFFFLSEMALLIQIATILSFLTAPFYAIVSFLLLTSKHTPKEAQPGLFMKSLSIIGIIALVVFSIYYITSL